MGGFKFERNLPHQLEATNALLQAFSTACAIQNSDKAMANVSNPHIELDPMTFGKNMRDLQENFFFGERNYKVSSNVLDISMETGTDLHLHQDDV